MKDQLLFLGSDHRGFTLKQDLRHWLESKQISYQDLGNNLKDDQDDYPDFAQKVAQTVAQDDKALGVLICGTGIGMCIVANKVPGIRAAVAHSVEEIQAARSHNHLNILCLAADWLDSKQLGKLIQAFLETPVSNEARHQRRLHKLAKMENLNTI